MDLKKLVDLEKMMGREGFLYFILHGLKTYGQHYINYSHKAIFLDPLLSGLGDTYGAR